MIKIPNYLKHFSEAYKKDPRKANLDWFRNANFGLFLHYGLYSIMGEESKRGEGMMEWVQFNRKIPVTEYAELKERFTARNFDADGIAAFAKECGMKYINITTRHHESFCLFETCETDFNSLNSPAKRDIVKELATACEKYELGLFLYYSHGRDWKHPHAPNNCEWGGAARPKYQFEEKSYKYGAEHNLDIYLEFMKSQVKELLIQYPTAAGIWLDGISVPMSGDYKEFKCDELYDVIRNTSPHALVSYKQGLLGTEDFFAPEHKIPEQKDEGEDYQKGYDPVGKIKDGKDKIIEVCTTMIENPVSWGYKKEAIHLGAEKVRNKINQALKDKYNLLLNIGVKPDGELDANDIAAIRKATDR